MLVSTYTAMIFAEWVVVVHLLIHRNVTGQSIWFSMPSGSGAQYVQLSTGSVEMVGEPDADIVLHMHVMHVMLTKALGSETFLVDVDCSGKRFCDIVYYIVIYYCMFSAMTCSCCCVLALKALHTMRSTSVECAFSVAVMQAMSLSSM